MTQQTAQLTEDQIRERVRERLVNGSITRDQAAQVLQAWKSQQQPSASAQQPQQPQQDDGGGLIRSITQSAPYQFANQAAAQFNRSVLGMGETAMTMGSQAVAEPLSGIMGLATLPFASSETAARNVEATREALTYEPRSQAGQQAIGEMGQVLEPIGRGVQAAEEFTGELGYRAGGPLAGAVTSAIPAAVMEVIGLKGSRQAKSAALQRAVDEAGPSILTPEARQALTKQGFTDAELSTMAAQDPAQLERLARFQRLGIQPTRGDITQRLPEQKAEAQLLERASGESGAGIRQLRRQQSQQITRNIEDLIDETGVPGDVGQSIKDALSSRRQMLRQEVRGAYDALSQAQGDVDVPLMMTNYRALPDVPQGPELRAIQRADRSKFQGIEDLMAEYGLSDDADALARLERDGVTPQALNLSNFEEFRKALNAAERADQTGNLSRVIGPIKRELDRQVDVMTETLEMSDNPNISQMAKDARLANVAYKTEFDPKAMTERLVTRQTQSNLPQIEDSQVYLKLAANSTPIEQVDRVVQSLKNEGAAGRRALSDLQSQVMLDLLDSAFTGITRKVDGQEMVSGAAMSRRFDKIADKAKLIFEDNPGALRQIEDVIRAAEDITPQSIAVPKGSAGFLMDVLEKTRLQQVFQRIPAAAAAIEGLRELSARSQNRVAFSRALKARPDLRRTATILATDYPSLAAAMGMGYLISEGEENESDQNQ